MTATMDGTGACGPDVRLPPNSYPQDALAEAKSAALPRGPAGGLPLLHAASHGSSASEGFDKVCAPEALLNVHLDQVRLRLV